MSGINSLIGLNKVSVDFQPAIANNVPNAGKAKQPELGADAVPEAALQPVKAKSVVQELDVLLLHAAGKSVSSDATKNVRAVGKSLTTKSGEELVFKSEFDSRIGMNSMLLGMNGAYRDAQKTASSRIRARSGRRSSGASTPNLTMPRSRYPSSGPDRSLDAAHPPDSRREAS